MSWKYMMELAIDATCREWGSPWSRPVLEMVGVVTAGVLVLAAAARAFGGGL